MNERLTAIEKIDDKNIIAAGPITKQPNTIKHRYVAWCDDNGKYGVHCQQFINFCSSLCDGYYFGKGQLGFEAAIRKFSEKMRDQIENMSSIFSISEDSEDKLLEIAKQMWAHVNGSTRSAVGAHDPVFGDDNGKPRISFGVKIKCAEEFLVTVVCELDNTYTVTLSSGRYPASTRKNIYAQVLSDVVFNMCNQA